MKKKTLIISALIILGLSLPVGASNNTNWPELAEKISAQSRESEKQARYTRELIQKDKQELARELQRLKSELQSRKQELEDQKETFQSILDREQELKSQISDEKEEIKQVQDTVFNSAQDIHALIRQSPISAEYPERLETIRPFLAQERFPGMQEIQDLVKLLKTELQASGLIRKYRGEFIGPQGLSQNGTIVRMGAITAAYLLKDQGAGYLTLNKDYQLTAVSGRPSWFMRRSLAAYIRGESTHVPLDLSGGSVFKLMSEGRDFLDWLRAGGLLVWPIFMIGGVALILAMERFVFLLRVRSNSDLIMSRINTMVSQGQWQKCRDYCARNQRFPTCRILSQVLDHLGTTRETVENSIQEAILRQLPRLERFIPTLSILGAIAPLLGLLGTVTGMINTFQVITLFGTGDPKLMSGGISEALVTTQLGLAVAIPIILLHHFLERRVDKILSDIEEKGNSLTMTLLKQGLIRESGDKIQDTGDRRRDTGNRRRDLGDGGQK